MSPVATEAFGAAHHGGKRQIQRRPCMTLHETGPIVSLVSDRVQLIWLARNSTIT